MTSDPFSSDALAARPPIDDPIKRAITTAFAIVPPGHTSAVVAIVDQRADGTEARLHAAVRVGTRWQVGGQVGWTSHAGISTQVAVMGSW